MKKLLAKAIAAAAIFIIAVSCSGGQKDMPVSVKFGESTMLITNNSTNIFKNVRVKINEDYKTELYLLSAGETKELGYFEFSNASGEMLNAELVRLNNLYISGECNGDKYWTYFKR